MTVVFITEDEFARFQDQEKDIARLTAENKDLHEQVAALESKEVCNRPHDDNIIEGCPYCRIEDLVSKELE